MKLSKLVYEVVKSVSFNDDTNFTYDGFIRGQYDNDFQYAVAINNAFTPISTAIHRLSDSFIVILPLFFYYLFLLAQVIGIEPMFLVFKTNSFPIKLNLYVEQENGNMGLIFCLVLF